MVLYMRGETNEIGRRFFRYKTKNFDKFED